MATYGQYETVQELARSGFGSVSTARPQGTQETAGFVVKAFHPSVHILGADAVKPAIDTFLDRARCQQRAAGEGASHWVKVLEMGADEESAYFVTRHYNRSAQKLINTRVKLTDAALLRVVESILKGLQELKASCARSHGNLKPTNVLIHGEGDITDDEVALTDPARDRIAAAGGEANDLYALGELIHQLVLHRPFRSHGGWPVPPSQEWGRLGKMKDAWREFCNRLLNPDSAERITTLDGAIVTLDDLRNPRKSRVVPITAALLLAAVVTTGAWAWVKYAAYRGQWRALCAEYAGWVQPLRDSLADPARRTRYGQDPYLRDNVVAPLEDADAREVPLNPQKIADKSGTVEDLKQHPPLNLEAEKKTRAALAVVRGIREALRPTEDHWAAVARLEEARKQFEARSWHKPAELLAGYVAAAAPGTALPEGIDRILSDRPRLDKELADIEQTWRDVESFRQKLDASGDAVLKKFGAYAAAAASDAAKNAGPGLRGLGDFRVALAVIKDLGDKLAKAADGDWGARIDRRRLAQDGPAYKAASLRAEDFQQWLSELPQYRRYALSDTGEPMAAINDGLKKIDDGIDRLRQAKLSPHEISPLEAKREDVRKKVADLRARPWVQKEVNGGELAAAAGSLVRQLDQLRTEVDAAVPLVGDPPDKWMASLPTRLAGEGAAYPPAITETWQKWAEKLLAGVSANDLAQQPYKYVDLRNKADRWAKVLTPLATRFPTPNDFPEEFGKMLAKKRDEVLRKAVASIKWDGEPVEDRAALSSLEVEYRDWQGALRDMINDFRAAEARLDQAYGLDEGQGPGVTTLSQVGPTWRDRPVFNEAMADPVVRAKLEDRVLGRIEALRQVPQMSPQQLVATAKGRSPALAVAAWRHLGALTDPGPWPSRPADFADETAIRLVLPIVIDAIAEPVRKDALKREMEQQGLVRWARFINAARPQQEIEPAIRSALAAAEQFGVDPDKQAKELLTPPARYNLLLNGLKQHVATAAAGAGDGKGAAASLDAPVAEFLKGVESLPAVKDDPTVAALVRKLRSSREPEPKGPGDPWKVTTEPGQGDRKLVCKWTPPGQDQTIVLTFFKVTSTADPGIRPFYLCQTEVSLELFDGVVGWQAKWPRFEALLVRYPDPWSDPRLGPRVWAWNWDNPRGERSFGKATHWERGDRKVESGWLAHDQPNGEANYPENRRNPIDPPFRGRYNLYTVEDKIGGEPGPKHPLQWVSLPAAQHFAELLGCRLPSPAEWQAAYSYEKHLVADDWNLRDVTWDEQKQYVAALARSRPLLPWQWPDDGIFWPKGMDRAGKVHENAKAVNSNDGILWFAEVDLVHQPREAKTPFLGGGQFFYHLVGNVAEYVWDPDAAKPYVIGGSAMSPPGPEFAWNKPLEVDEKEAAAGYSDVGFRLAFPAPIPDAERVKLILSGQPYLKGGGPTTAPADGTARG